MVNYQKEALIEYQYPDLGTVEVRLENESASIYEFLRSKGEIECFEKLDQLGALRTVHKSSHHSRWEYMVLQMYLVEELGKKKVFGLSTSVPLTKQLTISSIVELVKSWVLLVNYGHSYDTLEAERVWLELALSDRKLYDVFIDSMPDQQSQQYAKKVLEKEDLFYFHHLISLALIKRLYRKKTEGNKEFRKWVEMVKALLRDTLPSTKPKEGSKLDRALSIFNTIRRVSYVLLDINRSTLFVRIDSNNLLRNLLQQPENVLYDADSTFNKTLEDMVRLLFSEVYASEKACKFKYKYILGQKNRFKQKRDVILKDSKTLAANLYQLKAHNLGNYEQVDKIHICRINSLADLFERCDCLFHKEQNELKAIAGVQADFMVTPTSYSSAGSILDVFAKRNLEFRELGKLFKAIMDYLIKCYGDWLEKDGTMNFVTGKTGQELFSKILSIFISPELIVRFPTGTNVRDYHVDLIGGEVKRGNWVRGMSEELKQGQLSPSRKWELRKMLELLRRQTGDTFLVSCSNVHLYNRSGKREVEWDGVFIQLDKNKTILYLLEAKMGKSKRSKECSSALGESIIRSGIKLNEDNVKIVPCKGYAYTKIEMGDLVLSRPQ
jgi:hypothetical protein